MDEIKKNLIIDKNIKQFSSIKFKSLIIPKSINELHILFENYFLNIEKPKNNRNEIDKQNIYNYLFSLENFIKIIKKFNNEKLKEYEIVNEAGNRTGGFYHRSILFNRGIQLNQSKINYINRTWERYEFQTSMSSVIRKERDEIERLELENWKERNNVNRMTAVKREEFEKYLKDKKILEVYELMLKEIE